MSLIDDHPLRYALANELHARPFPEVAVPSRAAFLAIKPAQNAAGRDRAADRAHLVALLDRFGATHPQPGATHWSGRIGRFGLKWESHTEFVTYTLFLDGLEDRAFDPRDFAAFPAEWLAAAPGVCVTSALIRIETAADDSGIAAKCDRWFVPESLALARVIDNQLVVASDFRIDSAGHIRVALWARPGVSARRVGRVLQRMCEIETYKAMSMLGLARARDLGPRMGDLDRRLTALVADMTAERAGPDQTLHQLLGISAEVENLIAQSAFRFGATAAYEKIVHDRIAVLREERFEGRQTLAEFMMRRYDPAMRTVRSTEAQLQALSARAIRAGDLLRTRVDVERSAQNQLLLESMDRRADLQLRLQHTVEGLSVVAISYYALNLVLYVLKPFAPGVPEGWVAAVAAPVVVLAVWLGLRRIRRHLE